MRVIGQVAGSLQHFHHNPTHSYTLPHRYSSFLSLSQSLATEIGETPPGTLPSKRTSPWSLPFLSGGTLSEPQLIERRAGLERWLRGLVASKDPRWSGARALREFLAAPVSEQKQGFSSASWLVEQGELSALARGLRATFGRRDALIMQSRAEAHAVGMEGKRGLVELVRRLSELTVGLDGLAKGGMVQGELGRRSEMLGQLQDEAEMLGKLASEAPRVGSGKKDGQRVAETPSAERSALLSSKAPSRVLGLGSTHSTSLETPETRPLDNASLLTLQQTYVASQDSKLDALTAALRRQRALGEMINEELAVHGELLDQLESGTDRVSGRMKEADRMMRKL
ncbi:hypothetical protein BCR35DRAFT_318060 [Leucosporidium creatinivorum]|uniref:Phox homologous domain-containing protein n=1 Tax=Leucosporidium creatinivorum TaxID=106004 RepID=A0A1Y2FEL0_9BASI|nr:hypothetical protein BCR35DRAFT_318060 [Leucosporidium creatinivorum]